MDNAAAVHIQSPADAVLERVRQATACVVAIENVLLDREVNPGEDTLSDHVLQGLASAATTLLSQASDAAHKEATAHG